MADKTTNDLCQKARELMFDYADETLNERDAAWLEAHITSCPDCAAELAKCRETLKLIKVGRYEPPFSIADAVMNRIEKEEVTPLASAFTGFFKKKHFARYGTVAAALILVAVALLNQNALSRLAGGLTSSNEAAEAAKTNSTMARDIDAYSYSAKSDANKGVADGYAEEGDANEGITEASEIDETVRHVETVSGMMMASPTASGTGSEAEEVEEEASEQEKATEKRYGDSDPAVTEAPVALRTTGNALETAPETGAVAEMGKGDGDSDRTEAAADAPASDSHEEEQGFGLYSDVETSENYSADDMSFYYLDPAESYGNVVAYLNVSDLNAAMAVLGLTEYATIENSDGREGILCVYTFDERADIIDYLRLTNINYAVHYSRNDISEDETNYILLSEIK